MADYATERAHRDALERAQSEASRRWNAIPGVGSGPCGMTPDAVKFSAEYRDAALAYRRATDALGKFNRTFVKRYTKELRAERDARRTSLLQGN